MLPDMSTRRRTGEKSLLPLRAASSTKAGKRISAVTVLGLRERPRGRIEHCAREGSVEPSTAAEDRCPGQTTQENVLDVMQLCKHVLKNAG